ncbi:hypothetical protein [Actinoplanes solisilvae]|uniref:CIS tube protein n=1 Tax=Actinoplanes solisilvae TaxID=2486853 RepID=UPI000FDC0B2F|nr:hypothetical protein [Actinoplanes solisilvae]
MIFVPATLQRLDDVKGGPKDKKAKVTPAGPVVTVQFNPTSLKLERRNNVSKGGATVKTAKRTTPSTEPATLSFDLEFDTAEEGSLDHPADVRVRTAEIRKFVEQPPGSADPPPRVQFKWGTFTFNGIMDRVSEDLDYFAADGTPLRAKLSVTISEQDLQLEGNDKGAGKRDAATATDPGGSPKRSGPGTSGTSTRDRVVTVNDRASAPDVLAGLGKDPSAWRSLMNNLDNPFELGAGAQVELGAEIDGAGGIGVSAGFAAGAGISAGAELSAALGLGPDTSPGGAFDVLTGGSIGGSFIGSITGAAGGGQPGREAGTTAGFLLAAGGGIQRSLDVVRAGQAGAAVAQARSAFATPAPAGPTGTPPPPAGLPRPPPGAASAGSRAVTTPPQIDRRALGYGRAVPLRARANAPTLADSEAGGRRSVAARARPQETPTADRAGSAPWEQLPPAAGEQQRRRDARPRTMRWRPGGECT